MAQTAYFNDITDFSIVDGNVLIKRLDVVHEPDNSVIGVGANRPYVGVWLTLRAAGGAPYTIPAGRGKLDIEGHYEDSTSVVLTSSENPMDNIQVPNHTDLYLLVHADGQAKTDSQPSASATLSSSATASIRERLPLDASKTIETIRYYWTDN